MTIRNPRKSLSGATRPTRVGVFRDLFGSMGARVVVLPIGGAAIILGSRLVVQETGAEGFAWFSLLITLPTLIPISDFGIGAALTDVVARDGIASRRFWKTLKTVMRLLLSIWGASSIIAITMACLGLWSVVLGIPSGFETEFMCAGIAVFAATGIPLGAAQRILLSLGRQTLSTVVLGMGGVWSLAATTLVSLSGSDNFGDYSLAYASGPLVAQIILGAVVTRVLYNSRRSSCEEEAGVDDVNVRMTAIPMAIIAITLPLAYQSDRTVLAHVSTMNELSSYSLVAILYVPLLSILSVGGQTLWPLFMRKGLAGKIKTLYWQAFSIFLGLGIMSALGLVVVGPVIARIVGGADAIAAPTSTYLLFAVLLVVFAAHTANGMLLMDRRGRTVQALGSVALLAVKIPLALYLGSQFGADGVITSTIFAVIVCLFVPACFEVPRYWRCRRETPRQTSDVRPAEERQKIT